jgi:hypothetical protein
MKWVLFVVSIVFGYTFSQLVNGLFVYFFYFEDRAETVPLLPLITVIWFLIVGLITGFLQARIARTWWKLSSVIAAGLVVLVTILNIYLNIAAEPLSHKLIVIFVLAPAIVFGSQFGNKAETPESE